MGSYQLPPDIVDAFNALEARVQVLERRPAPATAVVSQTVPQAVNGPSVAVIFGTAVFDKAKMWDATQPTRLRVPTGIPAGVFLLAGRARITAGAAGGQAIINSSRNGVLDLKTFVTFAAGEDFAVPIVHPMLLHGGDYVELFMSQGSGVACTASECELSLTLQR